MHPAGSPPGSWLVAHALSANYVSCFHEEGEFWRRGLCAFFESIDCLGNDAGDDSHGCRDYRLRCRQKDETTTECRRSCGNPSLCNTQTDVDPSLTSEGL